MSDPLLTASNLAKTYPAAGAFGRRPECRALDGVSFELEEGETLAIAGESGSGKTTLGLIVARLEEPSAGTIRVDGLLWSSLRGAALRRERARVQMVFQDPSTSLNPRLTVGESIGEPLRAISRLAGRALAERTAELLASVGIDPAAAGKRPRELSGGERQRVAIARALAPRPRVVVGDELVASLDLSARAGVLNLLLDLQEATGVSYLFISHDLEAIRRVADRVAILYAGRIVEESPARQFFAAPRHPYSAALLAGRALPGEPPESGTDEGGCRFEPRCGAARPRCREEDPALVFEGPRRRVACFFPGEPVENEKLSGENCVSVQ